jgi:hypothetical protein
MYVATILRVGAVAGVVGGMHLAAAEAAAGEGHVPPTSVLAQAPYPGITVLRRETGDATWQAALPEPWRKLRATIGREAGDVAVPYVYDGAPAAGPQLEKIYRNHQAVICDPQRCVAVSIVSRHPADTGVGFPDEKLWYRVSTDGGATWDRERPIIQTGAEYSPMHPNRYVWVGRNGFETAAGWIGRMSNGQILFPFCYAPLGADGKQYNPLRAFTFSYVACLIGSWNEAGTDIVWDVSAPAEISADLASRGVSECAVVELLKSPGHILIVSRGGNEPNTGTQKACHWRTLSTDYGKTWSAYTPFTYETGEEFFSPASFCNAIRSSKTGKVYWVGNITRAVPRGNLPRFPLVIGEIDEEKLALRKATVTIVDDRQADDPPNLQLSNFGLLEDPATGNLLITLTRSDFQAPVGENEGLRTYVIEVK